MRPLWLDPDLQQYSALGSDVAVDVAVIGAGLSGIGAAWQLRDGGMSVAVLEARTVASGASGRNGGFVLRGPAAGFRQLAEVQGVETARAIWELTDDNARTIADLVEEYDIANGYLRRGSMSLAADEEEWEDVQQDAAALTSDGISVCLAERDDLPRPFDRTYHGGLYYPGNAEMNSGIFVRQVAQRLGPTCTIYERTRVESMSHDGQWTLVTPAGSVRASTVILASNAWTAGLLPVPIEPTQGQVVASDPIDHVLVPFPLYANRGYQYWRQTADGTVVVGGWRNLDLAGQVGLEEAFHDRIQDALAAFLESVAPGSRPLYRWVGIMGFTPDMVPLVGSVPDQPGLYIAAGYSGHGVAMAFTCGRMAAQAATGEPAAIPPAFDPARFIGARAG